MQVSVFFISAGVLAVLIFLLTYPRWQKHKLAKKIAAGFGKPPAKTEGRLAGYQYWQAGLKAAPDTNSIDDITWNDLGMDTIFHQINNCQCAAGDVILYNTLRHPMQPEAALSQRETLIDVLCQNDALRMKVQLELAGLGRRDAGLDASVFSPGILLAHRIWLFRLCAFLPLLSLGILFIHPAAALLWLLVTMVGNLVFFQIAKARIETSFGAVRYICSAVACAGNLVKILRPYAPAQAEKLALCIKPFSAFMRSNLILKFDYLTSEMGLWDPLSFFLIPMLSYNKMAKVLCKAPENQQALVEALGETDLCCAVLNWRQYLPLWCTPCFEDAPRLSTTSLYHPLLSEAVTNNFTSENNVLFTGSNASGKSTFIKALALGCILGQAINTCPAQSFTLKRGLVASSMAVADSVVDGDSYFMAEIKSMQRLISLAGPGCFCYFFIDEILKGTNTIERIAASAAVLRHLQTLPCLCFAATHDVELTSLLGHLYDNAHFNETITQDDIFFDYKLKSGPATSRNAILLLQHMQYPADITNTANRLVHHFETKGEWKF